MPKHPVINANMLTLILAKSLSPTTQGHEKSVLLKHIGTCHHFE